MCQWIKAPARAGGEAQHAAVLHQEPDLGPCDFSVTLPVCLAADPVLFPEEGESRNVLKARVGRSFPEPGCSSQVDGCAGDPVLSPGFLLKVT